MDILATAALIELLVIVKCAIFMPTTGLYALLLSDVWSFQNMHLDSKGDQLNPVMLAVLIFMPTHLDKAVMCPGQGMWKKGVDALLA